MISAATTLPLNTPPAPDYARTIKEKSSFKACFLEIFDQISSQPRTTREKIAYLVHLIPAAYRRSKELSQIVAHLPQTTPDAEKAAHILIHNALKQVESEHPDLDFLSDENSEQLARYYDDALRELRIANPELATTLVNAEPQARIAAILRTTVHSEPLTYTQLYEISERAGFDIEDLCTAYASDPKARALTSKALLPLVLQFKELHTSKAAQIIKTRNKEIKTTSDRLSTVNKEILRLSPLHANPDSKANESYINSLDESALHAFIKENEDFLALLEEEQTLLARYAHETDYQSFLEAHTMTEEERDTIIALQEQIGNLAAPFEGYIGAFKDGRERQIIKASLEVGRAPILHKTADIYALIERAAHENNRPLLEQILYREIAQQTLDQYIALEERFMTNLESAHGITSKEALFANPDYINIILNTINIK